MSMHICDSNAKPLISRSALFARNAPSPSPRRKRIIVMYIYILTVGFQRESMRLGVCLDGLRRYAESGCHSLVLNRVSEIEIYAI
jgi:hypothetical protein